MKDSRTFRRRACLLAACCLLCHQAPAQQPDHPLPPPRVAPYSWKDAPVGGHETLPIDLVTALRLANASNPTIGLAQARVRQALARLDQASVLFLPTLSADSTYYRHDGQTQNQRGDVFSVSRSNVFAGGGARLHLDVSEALFLPLVARRLTEAESARARAVSNDVQLDVALAYLDLLQVHGQLAINADTLARAQQMLDFAVTAERAGLAKTQWDVNRARTEINLRNQERLDLLGRAGAVSAQLARLLLLQPTVDLRPADTAITPLVLVPPGQTLDQLVEIGLMTRPELAADRAALQAAETRLRQARLDPLIPRVQMDYLGGTFGGGRNSFLGDFEARGDFTATVYWELRNLGLGNVTEVRERSTVVEQTNYRLLEVQARIGAEVSAAAKLAAARFRTLDAAQEAVRQASEMYRKLDEYVRAMVARQGAKFEAIELLLAIQALNQARQQYLAEVVEFNRAQFRLYTALGQPAECALPEAVLEPLTTPVLPPAGAAGKPRSGQPHLRGVGPAPAG